MGKRPFRANYSQMVPALFRGWLAGPPYVPRGFGNRAKVGGGVAEPGLYPALSIASRLPRAAVTTLLV